MRAKPFRIAELGAGIVPYGLVRKAARSRPGQRRELIGVDKNLRHPLLAVLRAGRLHMPKNLELRKEDAVETLRSLSKRSHSVLFASYLFNNIPTAVQLKILSLAKRALRPRGRFYVVQDKSFSALMQKRAMEQGFAFSVVDIPYSVAKKSPAAAIRDRATPKKRIRYFRFYASRHPEHFEDLQKLLESGAISSMQEYAKPTIFVFRKPAKEK